MVLPYSARRRCNAQYFFEVPHGTERRKMRLKMEPVTDARQRGPSLWPVSVDGLGVEMRKQRSRSRKALRKKGGAIASHSAASWRQIASTITGKLSAKRRHRKSPQGLIRVDVTCDGR
jgi:hypothetical protein